MSKCLRMPYDNGHIEYYFYCAGCQHNHSIVTKWGDVQLDRWHKKMDQKDKNSNPPMWRFTGSLDHPTISPSVLYKWAAGEKSGVCHFFVKQGVIEYLEDCTHQFKGKKLGLENVKPYV